MKEFVTLVGEDNEEVAKFGYLELVACGT